MSSQIEQYAEIGCGGGVSTTAVVEALGRGREMRVDLCDIEFQPPVLEMKREWVASKRISLHEVPSHEYLEGCDRLDFVFLDGDHRLVTVEGGLEIVLTKGVKHICAHDTLAVERALAGGWDRSDFEPAFLREALQYLAGWFCLEEWQPRSNEATGRSFFYAIREIDAFERAKQIFRLLDPKAVLASLPSSL